jgi:hypothetical protein
MADTATKEPYPETKWNDFFNDTQADLYRAKSLAQALAILFERLHGEQAADKRRELMEASAFLAYEMDLSAGAMRKSW